MERGIIDAHHHIWRFDRTPWLSGPPVPRIFGDYEDLRRDYLIADYAADAGSCGVDASVYVQINVAPGDEVEEVEWVTTEGASEGLVQAVVGYADLEADDVGDVLDRQLAFRTLRGVRRQLHWHENPTYRFADSPDVMTRPAFHRGLREVQSRGLHFELQVFVGQFDMALELVDAFDEMTFVLLHAGMVEDRSDEAMAVWRDGLERFAERPNVLVKLSGLGTFTHTCSVEDWKPVIDRTLDAFGPDRAMFGSNFPVERLWTTYAELVEVVTSSISHLSSSERAAVLRDTAARLYRID